MRSIIATFISIIIIILFGSCNRNKNDSEIRIIFLHHSVGGYIWRGTEAPLLEKIASKISIRLSVIVGKFSKAHLPLLIKRYNKKYDKNYVIKEMTFPKVHISKIS